MLIWAKEQAYVVQLDRDIWYIWIRSMQNNVISPIELTIWELSQRLSLLLEATDDISQASSCPEAEQEEFMSIINNEPSIELTIAA